VKKEMSDGESDAKPYRTDRNSDLIINDHKPIRRFSSHSLLRLVNWPCFLKSQN
jgi:hypothetical protein